MKKLSFALFISIFAILILVVALLNLRDLFSKDKPSTPQQGDILGVESTYEIKVVSTINSLDRFENNDFEIQYLYKVTNNSQYTVRSLTSENSLNSTFKSHEFEILSIESDTFKINSAYNGKSNTDLLTGADTLAPNQKGTITLTARVHPKDDQGPFKNYIEVWGIVDGPIAEDKSKSKDNKQGENKDNQNKNNEKQKDTNNDSKQKQEDKNKPDDKKLDNNQDKVVGKDKNKKNGNKDNSNKDNKSKDNQNKEPDKNTDNKGDTNKDTAQKDVLQEDNNKVITNNAVYGAATTSFMLEALANGGANNIGKLPAAQADNQSNNSGSLARTGFSIRQASLIGFTLILSTIELYAIDTQKRLAFKIINRI